MSEPFKKLLSEVPQDTKRFVSRSMDISDQIVAILKHKGKNQKFLAEQLNKSESEISKWLSGNHNFTLRTLAKIETVLEEDVVVAPIYWREYKGIYSAKVAEEVSSFEKQKGNIFHTGVSTESNAPAKVAVKPSKEMAGEYLTFKMVA